MDHRELCKCSDCYGAFGRNSSLATYVILTYNLEMERVLFDKVRKNLNRLPIHIVRNLQRWALQVESLGIQEVRKIPGYHDEPLRGDRSGQRSIDPIASSILKQKVMRLIWGIIYNVSQHAQP